MLPIIDDLLKPMLKSEWQQVDYFASFLITKGDCQQSCSYRKVYEAVCNH